MTRRRLPIQRRRAIRCLAHLLGSGPASGQVFQEGVEVWQGVPPEFEDGGGAGQVQLSARGDLLTPDGGLVLADYHAIGVLPEPASDPVAELRVPDVAGVVLATVQDELVVPHPNARGYGLSLLSDLDLSVIHLGNPRAPGLRPSCVGGAA